MYSAFYKPKAGSNLCLVIQFLLNRYGLLATKFNINTLLDNHVEYPSLLAVKDTLYEYGIESVAIHKGKYEYADFETPFICAVREIGRRTAQNNGATNGKSVLRQHY